MIMDGPSAHLTWEELACHDGTPYPLEWREDRAVKLARVFEVIRAYYYVPLVINSAYRTKTYNDSIGGAPKSQHLEGLALDIQSPRNVPVREFCHVVSRMAHSSLKDIGGIGLYNTFIHVDLRPRKVDGSFAFWDLRK